MLNIPDVTVVITNYNYEKYLARCLRSCLSQKYVNHEVILVNDASTGSTDCIKPFMSDIVYIENESNSGVAASANVGLLNARGRYVTRVDGDDFISSEMCYFLMKYLEANHKFFACSCDYILVDEHEDKLERISYLEKPISCAIMYRKDLLVHYGGYDEAFRHREEEELRKRLGEYYKVGHIAIPFYRYRKHGFNKTLSKEYLETKI